LIAGALTTFVTVIVSVPPPSAGRAVDADGGGGGAPNRADIDGGWPAGGGAGGSADGPGGGCGTEPVCRGSANGARGGAGNETVLNRGTGAAALGVTQLLSDVCTCTTPVDHVHHHNTTHMYKHLSTRYGE